MVFAILIPVAFLTNLKAKIGLFLYGFGTQFLIIDPFIWPEAGLHMLMLAIFIFYMVFSFYVHSTQIDSYL